MNILMVLNSGFPHDWRVEKEAIALKNAGYNVFIMCNYDKNREIKEDFNEITILRCLKNKNKYINILNKIIFHIFFLDIITFFAIKINIIAYNIKYLHIHDLPLTKTGILAIGNQPVKIILDLHENYPEALQVWFNNDKERGFRSYIMKIIHNYKRWINYEKYCLANVHKIITVVSEMRDFLKKKYPTLTNTKICIVSNTEPADFKNQNKNQEILDKYSDKFYALYIGGLGWHRGVDTLMQSIKYLNKGITVLIIGGAAGSFLKYLRTELKQYSDEQVLWLGPTPNSHGASYISASSVGIVPHNSNDHCDNTIPHKIFHFMLQKKPLLVSSSKSLARVVRETNSGEIFNAGDEKDLALKLNTLYENKRLRKKYGNNGFKAASEENYSWEFDRLKLVELYKTI